MKMAFFGISARRGGGGSENRSFAPFSMQTICKIFCQKTAKSRPLTEEPPLQPPPRQHRNKLRPNEQREQQRHHTTRASAVCSRRGGPQWQRNRQSAKPAMPSPKSVSHLWLKITPLRPEVRALPPLLSPALGCGEALPRGPVRRSSWSSHANFQSCCHSQSAY